jgi:hypothetical protein
MATQRTIRPTANPRPRGPGQSDADPVLVPARRDLTGAVRDTDDIRRFVEAGGRSASTIHEVMGASV